MIVECIYTYNTFLDLKQMGLDIICQGMWVMVARAILFAERGFIGSQCPGNFCLLLFFCWNVFLHTKITHTLDVFYCNL